jgi:flagellar biosynthesis chaperone FliJ
MRALLMMLLVLPTFVLAAGPETNAQIRRLETAITRANEEQQSLHVRFQMMSEIRRSEQQRLEAMMPRAGVAAPPMNYDDMARLREEDESRARQHSDELDRIYTRFREIEEEKQRLREQLNQVLEGK